MTIRILRDCFPSWYERSQDSRKNSTFAQPCSIGTDGFSKHLHRLIVHEQSLAGRTSPDHLFALSLAIAEDLVSLQQEEVSGIERLNLQYLQFETSIAPLRMSTMRGNANLAYDWILNGFSNEISNEKKREFETGRLKEFLVTKVAWISAVRNPSLQEWLADFYYYARRWAAVYEVATSVFVYGLIVLREPWTRPNLAVDAIAFMLNWASTYHHVSERDLAMLAEHLLLKSSLEGALKVRLVVALLPGGFRFTSLGQDKWADWALKNIATANIKPQERIQLLLASVNVIAEWAQRREAIYEALSQFAAEITASIESPVLQLLAIEQRSSILNDLVFKLHAYGSAEDLFVAYCIWYAVPEDQRRKGNVLFAMPNHSDGMAFLGLKSYSFPIGAADAVEELSNITNSALGLALTVLGQTTVEHVEERPGVPQYDVAPSFDKVITNHYSWKKLPGMELERADSIMFVPGYPHPVQAHMQREIGACLPITSSLRISLPNRQIAKAMIWYSGEDNYSALEADAVQAVLDTVGIECVVLCGTTNTVGDFLAAYSNPTFDMLWIAGHGNCDRWDPRSPAIAIGADGPMPIEQLVRVPITGTGRRLLVLNICDSGASSVFGGPHKIGMAPLLASSQQAVVGHIWPVDPIVAAGFGLCLANEIARDRSGFFPTFSRSIKALRLDWPSFVRTAGLGGESELIERLRNNERDLRNIFHWGSPCYFE